MLVKQAMILLTHYDQCCSELTVKGVFSSTKEVDKIIKEDWKEYKEDFAEEPDDTADSSMTFEEFKEEYTSTELVLDQRLEDQS